MKVVSKLQIKDVKHLGMRLGSNTEELLTICETLKCKPEVYYKRNTIVKNNKERKLATPQGRLRDILIALNKLLQTIKMPSFVHGGIPEHSTSTNAIPHLNSDLIIRADIEKHFPNISSIRVYNMFLKNQACSPDVARILTRLTTLDGCLPQGSQTSTAISNLVTLELSGRLHNFARRRGAKCTQFVDDYTFSGKKQLATCKTKIADIIRQSHFKVNEEKLTSVAKSQEQIVTGIKVNNASLDVPKSKPLQIRSQLRAMQNQKRSGITISEKEIGSVRGKINYVKRFNKGAGRQLEKALEKLLDIKIIIND